MKSLTAATAAVVGSLALAVPTASAAPASVRSTFDARAGAVCQSYFTSVKSADAVISTRLGAAPTAVTQIVVTAELLYTNANLSLAAEGRLAQLAAPPADTKLWAAMLEADRTGGLLTLRTAQVLPHLLLSENAANAAVDAYETAYEQVEAGWDAGVKLLGITGCE